MDNNGNGLIDCKDEACINEDICNIAPVMQEICDDGLDNDGDDKIDCDDPDCDTSGSCFFSNLPSNGSHSSDSAEGYGNGAGSDSSDGYPQYGDGNNDPYSARHQIALIDCSASPVRSTPAPLAVLFGMLGIGALMRRRRHSH